MHDTNQFTVMKLSESYWKVRFQNGPINLWDVDSLEELSGLLATIEAAPSLTVVVFVKWQSRFLYRTLGFSGRQGPCCCDAARTNRFSSLCRYLGSAESGACCHYFLHSWPGTRSRE